MSKERELLRKLFESGIQPEQTETEFNQESVSEPFAGFELRVDSCPPEQIEESPPYDMRIHSNPSALAWTTFFREHNPECNLDDDIMLCWFANAMMAMHDHIYQSTQPEQTEQEPVGIVRTIGGYPDNSTHTVELTCRHGDLRDGDLLYTAPPKREPLREDAIWAALPENPMGCAAFIRGVKFAEKAHGIGE